MIDATINIEGDIYKPYSQSQKMHILGILDIKKMIPVPEGYFEKIIFDCLDDVRYQDLFKKEYAFCLKIKDKVLSKAEKIYYRQKETGEVKSMHCNFNVCEKAMLEWVENRIEMI